MGAHRRTRPCSEDESDEQQQGLAEREVTHVDQVLVPHGGDVGQGRARFPTAPTPNATMVAGTVTRTTATTFASRTRPRWGTRGERGQPAALAPLGGDRQDRDDRQDDRHRDADGEGELAGRELLLRRPGDDRAGGEDSGDPEAREQPEAGAGVEGLAELHPDQSCERDVSRCCGGLGGRRPDGAATGRPGSGATCSDGGHATAPS
jgi:hypothetical protein